MKITESKFIPHPPADVYRAAQQIERFPEFMENLQSAEILEEDGDVRVTRWTGKLSVGSIEREFSWTERDFWSSDELSCRFELVEGDVDEYSGSWQFEEAEGGCRTVLTVNFELDIPMLGAMLNQIVEDKVTENSQQLLEALSEICEHQD